MNFTLAGQAQTLFSVPGWLHAKLSGWSRQALAIVPESCAEMFFSRNQIREVRNREGVTVECLSGQIWITLDGDPRDVVLDPGQMFTAERDKRILVMALEEATVRWTGPASI